MKKNILGLICCFSLFNAKAQTFVGIETGIGKTIMQPLPGRGLIGDAGYSLNSNTVQELGVYLQKKITKRTSLGLDIYFQQYAVQYSFSSFQGVDYDYQKNINYYSAYTCIAPYFDLGIGITQKLHFYFIPAYGFMCNGYENTYISVMTMVGKSHNYSNTSAEINRNPIVQLNLGLKESFKLNNDWFLLVNEGIRYMPVSTNFSDGFKDIGGTTLNINPMHYSIQLGIMRAYHHKNSVTETKPQAQQ